MENLNFRKNNEGLTISLKLLLIGGLILGLLIPSGMILMLIKERKERQVETINEINSKWAYAQVLCGPIITIPYISRYKEGEKVIETTEYAHFTPEELNIAGNMIPQQRYRGIYNVVVYNTLLKFKGDFGPLNLSKWNINENDVRWDEAFMSIGIQDMRGINKKISILWNEKPYDSEPGTKLTNLLQSGINVKIPVNLSATSYQFSFDIDLNGSESLQFIPIGSETYVKLNSTWKNPSFQGSFIPKEKSVTENGFNATWKIIELNLNYPNQWLNDQYKLNLKSSLNPQYDNSNYINSAFGVTLTQSVDVYQMSERSVKYAILFIALTFLVIFFAEMLMKKRVHPIQYILIGIALCLFYSLLIAFAEYINFSIAYLIAALTIIGLISFFTKSVFSSLKMAINMAAVLTTLYTFLFILLKLEDYALLFGNIGLVLIIGVVMYISQKINWYGDKNLITDIVKEDYTALNKE
jgi:inner membrane protein